MLLDSAGPQASAQGLTKRCDPICRQNLPWELNGYTRLRKQMSRWLRTSGQKFAQDDEQTLLKFLSHLRRICVSETPKSALLFDMSLVSVWFQCLCEFLPLGVAYQLNTLQSGMSHFLDELQPTMRRSEAFAQQLREVFLPALNEIRDEECRSQSIEDSLLVIISLTGILSTHADIALDITSVPPCWSDRQYNSHDKSFRGII